MAPALKSRWYSVGEPSGEMAADIRVNLDRVRERITAAARRANRTPEEVTLVVVTKTHPPEVVRQVLACGVRHVGENRLGELEAKRQQVERIVPDDLPAPIWHMVGHVQSRKAARAVQVADMIESVDSRKLARRLDRLAAEAGRRVPVLLQVNVSGEESKYGWSASAWEENSDEREAMRAWVAAVLDCRQLEVQGLMTMAPWTADEGAVRAVFQSLRRLGDWLRDEFPASDWRHLSMGMSDDYEIAIEEGATLVRIGRAILGPRIEA